MRIGHFEALAPVCPLCLHSRGVESPLVLAHVAAERAGQVIEGLLHCSDPGCWIEFPIIDGVPILTPDPRGYLQTMAGQVLTRQDLSALLASYLGDALGPEAPFATTRQHLSIYGTGHYADWIGSEAPAPDLATVLNRGLALLGDDPPAGPAMDLGCSVGRGAWELAAARPGLVLGADMNFAMLQLAQRLMRDGEAVVDRRRVGIVYDPVRIALPEAARKAAGRIDFWAVDAHALPFPAGRFALVTGLSLVDCLQSPAQGVAELARLLPPGGQAVLTTPYDWSAAATAIEGWLGGHSQRTDAQGSGGGSEPALRAALGAAGLDILAEDDGLTWRLPLHARSMMEYRLHLLALSRRAEAEAN